MSTLLGLLLAAIVSAQDSDDRIATGTVVDEQGMPIAEAKLVLYGPPNAFEKGEPAEERGLSDGEGRFKLLRLRRGFRIRLNLWASRPGLAIAAVPYENSKPHQIALRKPDPRTVRVEGADGKPVAGARVQPRLVFFSGGIASADMPESLASPLAVMTGADGIATITYLRGRDRLVAVRVTSDTIGEQDVPVTEESSKASVLPTILIKLRSTGRIAGRIVDPRGQGIANQAVEIWSKGGGGRLIPNPVGFKDGPIRTGADGAFITPDNLIVGAAYRVTVREPGNEPIISDWIDINEQPVTIAPLVLRSLRTIKGRVIDRQGKAIAQAEMIQSGDGPERTTVRTDSAGRFALGGFQHGPVFLFAQ